MTPQQFVVKWQAVDLSERSAYQQHFLDLCELLGQPKPADADPEGAWYTFERGVQKTEGGDGWADVWMKGHFGWEYKGKHKNLVAAYKQLLLYREDLENPPLLVVCDLDRFEIHTNFTGTLKVIHAFDLNGLADPQNLEILRKVFTDPNALRPGVTAQLVTEQAAELIGQLADGMRVRNIPAPRAAHFLMKLMFCMFAEDIELLPGKVFSRIMDTATKSGAKGLVDVAAGQRFAQLLRGLFDSMAHGGLFGTEEILHFNGGLFADSDVIDLTPDEMIKLRDVSRLDWSGLEPSIFGTLFERTLDPAKRSQIGAHYTGRQDIVTLLEPVVMQPLRQEWADVKAACEQLTSGLASVKTAAARRKKVQQRDKVLRQFVERLAHVTILDPACGSGNFLYVALHLLLDLEKEVISFAARQGIGLLPQVRPTQLAGIEVNAYAQELASVVIWIGYLQWMHHNGFNPPSNPVLEPIESIKRMDAILDLSDPDNPTEPEWPEVDFIVGNPPFLGGKRILAELGENYTLAMRRVWDSRLSHFSDLCCYWFEKARHQVERRMAKRVGLLATQGIRGGSNRQVLGRIKASGDIFFAESDRDWVLDGATVHVSMVGFDNGAEMSRVLDGHAVYTINANLTVGADATTSQPLPENHDRGFIGVQKSGPFDVPMSDALEIARRFTLDGRPCSDVLRIYWTAIDVVRRPLDMWIIDFVRRDIKTSSLYAEPFEHLRKMVPEERRAAHFDGYPFWQLWRPRPEMYAAIEKLTRFAVTPHVSKHRIFAWAEPSVCPSNLLIAIATDEDWEFGVLHSRCHELWALAQGTQLRERESGFRYTTSTCFETFAFPDASDAQRNAIADAAKELDRLRRNWLNPPEWTRAEVLEFPGSADGPWKHYVDPVSVDKWGVGTVRYPRVVARDADSARQLTRRTLTNLYNERPTWLDLAHRRLDEAVFAAYGWPVDLSDDELLARLLELNRCRAAVQ